MNSGTNRRKIDLDTLDVIDIDIYEFKINNTSTEDILEYNYERASAFNIFIDEECVYITLYVDVKAIYDETDQDDGEEVCHLSVAFAYKVAGLEKLVTPAPDHNDGSKQAFLDKKVFFFLLNQSYTTLRGILWSKVSDTRYSNIYLPIERMEDVFEYYSATVLTVEED